MDLEAQILKMEEREKKMVKKIEKWTKKMVENMEISRQEIETLRLKALTLRENEHIRVDDYNTGEDNIDEVNKKILHDKLRCLVNKYKEIAK